MSAQIKLSLLERYQIQDEARGLSEPSGLALAQNGERLWTVCDESKRLYALNTRGQLGNAATLVVDFKGMEGITVSPDERSLYVVREDDNTIIRVSLECPFELGEQPLAHMKGYASVREHFEQSKKSKGLEGIAIRPSDAAVFVLKEGDPGLLIEISADLSEIVRFDVLNESKGFADNDTKQKKIDFSGLCYDPQRERMWIVSDKAKRVFLFDLHKTQVDQSLGLKYREDGDEREVEKVEGVAVDFDRNLMYVVSDEEARLYVFQIH